MRIGITCKEIEKFPAVREEDNYLLKTNRLNVLSSCGKSSLPWRRKGNTSVMVFYCNRCITNPSHYAELHSNFVGKTVISSLGYRKDRYLIGNLLWSTFICVPLACLHSDLVMYVKIFERFGFFPISLYYLNQYIKYLIIKTVL